ncbi:multi-sensor hybrid histidine kinase [Fibrella aestuarina BUZ 2]|uniref:Sensory/regulatory protein RpfC n=1 Tax=Fibrella aestuarina BUZ 2 TaxID=1166018 RepID=I0KF60_9BACT|nr:response regulator [Fibrella aestuarina]CCH02763.1 multi-sensor hybrid histidine kinase [Fibrella aestuarina BUZ 2]
MKQVLVSPSGEPASAHQQLLDEIERLRAEQQRLEQTVCTLQAENARLNEHWPKLLAGLGDTSWSYDLQTDELTRSPAYYQQLGYLTETPDWLTLLHPQDRPSWEYELATCRQDHQPYFSVTYRVRAQDGTYAYRFDLGYVSTSSDNVRSLRGVSGSLTVPGQLQQPLSRMASRLTNLMGQLQDGLLLEDEHRHIVLVNQYFCDLFGVPLSPQQLTGIDCSGMAEQSKSLFSDPEGFVARVAQLLHDRKPVLGDELELADGRIFERDYIPLFNDEQYTGHLWKYTDITRRKRAENAALHQKEKYQRIIENMNLGLIEVDLDERIVYTNQSFCAMSGYEPDELIGQIATDRLLRGQHVQIMKEKNNSRLEGIVDTYEVAIKNKRGEAMWWLISGAPLYSDDGAVIGSTGIHLDITKQKQLESDLRVAKEAAEDSSRAKVLFLANMSHEIRTPMNAILSLGQQLTKTTLSDKQQFLLSMINSAASNLLVILNDILDFSKIEAGQLSLEQIGFNLPNLLQSAAQVLTGQADEKGLRLNTRTDADIAPVVLGDPYRLNQILFNLLGNAIKFTETGSVTLDCQGYQQGNRQFVNIKVIDTGIGIEPAFQEKIFNKFTQEDGSIGRRYGGTGLGMSITKQLVDMMGGTISVDSRPGKGTTVQVLISFAIGQPASLTPPTQVTPPDDFLRKKRILLVEDNEMNRMVVQMILESYGPTIVEAVNGQKAIEALRAESFDLVLMDVQMPIMDGLEATRLIRREISTTLPIVALTASVIRSEQEECFQAGMNDFLGKPFDEKDLIAQLTKWLNPPQPANAVPAPLYNLEKLELISRGSEDFIRQMVQLFCTETPTTATQIRDACAAGDFKRVKYLAHRIKPSVDNMGVVAQVEVVRRIEELAQIGDDSDELRALVSSFDEAIHEVVKQMQARQW